jgi:hypothetical protein
MRARGALLAGVTAFLAVAPLDAQESLRAQCAAAELEGQRTICAHAADIAAILPARIGLTASGGNAVPGTASTLGMRLGSVPRVSLGLRTTIVGAELPPIGDERDRGFAVFGIAVDGSLGVYQGISLLPTVGGFGSIDLLASAAVLPLRSGSGFQDGTTLSWAAGARIGILRESFTAPGVSIDVLYRGVGDVAWRDPAAAGGNALLELDGNRVTSVRGVVGKRIFGFGATAGVAWDRYRSDATVTVPAFLIPPAEAFTVSESGLTTSRTSFFGNASLTLLILNLSLEAGWQSGGSAAAGASPQVGQGSLFGGVSARMAI